MLYPFMVLNDGTEIFHSESYLKGGKEQIGVVIKKPAEDGFGSAKCVLPEGGWEDDGSFTDQDTIRFGLLIDSLAHINGPAEAVYHEAEFSRIALQRNGYLEAGWMKVGAGLSSAEMAEAEILLALHRVAEDRRKGAQRTVLGNAEISTKAAGTAGETDEYESKVFIAAGNGHTAWSDGECEAAIATGGKGGAAMETGAYGLSAAVSYQGISM